MWWGSHNHTTAVVKVRQDADDSFVEMGGCLLIRLVEVAVKLTLGFGQVLLHGTISGHYA